MNRIILIGNGFDLAHNIKTSYTHFINDYWEKIIQKLRDEVNGNITTYLNVFETDEIKIENVPGNHYNAGDWVTGNTFDELINILERQNLELIFKNKFLEILTKKNGERNWVDIENEYYNLLKEAFRNEKCSYKIAELNNDLKQIQKLLEHYLSEVEKEFIDNFGNDSNHIKLKNNIGYKIYSPFYFKDFSESSINNQAKIEFQKVQVETKTDNNSPKPIPSEKSKSIISRIGSNCSLSDIRKLLISDSAINYFDLMPEEILFLNFNYTFTEKIYANHAQFDSFDSNKNLIKKYMHIHGTTDKYDRNDVIFGFGDEIDEDYKSIENLNDNDYLENIKSIKYLETDNYKNLLEFLNSDNYQIFIFGHSCGISDRTLLNTLFEHKNCCSIKPFYHQKDDNTDNYRDIVKNISRNFNNKSSMRDKVVNKEYCNSLS
ncbi:AbiH family protein [Flavobacterium urocaniciphilum]|uniref:Bacteriophage abortive infection AbiH n=1 Tax=Flavobacterium urocaniciphilum TaxID=1299341 RepID=A0A1H9D4L0_9FLAO|nr:AbiH family protein [Flavobacterium urocaniciphilum]SEQ08297.1 Bacteriophage abortive infection AbiH [Flavobacterium urocaniciphilum]